MLQECNLSAFGDFFVELVNNEINPCMLEQKYRIWKIMARNILHFISSTHLMQTCSRGYRGYERQPVYLWSYRCSMDQLAFFYSYFEAHFRWWVNVLTGTNTSLQLFTSSFFDLSPLELFLASMMLIGHLDEFSFLILVKSWSDLSRRSPLFFLIICIYKQQVHILDCFEVDV